MSYFPMFIELKDKPCLVVGGGVVALRKAETLRDFGARLRVVAPVILPDILAMPDVECLEKRFETSDLDGQELVVAATGGQEENHRISQACRERKIPVNAVDQKEDCDFIFPAYLRAGEVVAAFSSGGQSPAIAQYLKAQMKPAMASLPGGLAEAMGDLREQLRHTGTERIRKDIYQEILELGLEKGAVPSKEEMEKIIQTHIGSGTPKCQGSEL